MIRDKLHDLNPEKKPDPDGWHPTLLKNTSDLISFPLSVLLQKSLNEGRNGIPEMARSLYNSDT